jgi:hypothetical protein
VSGAGPSSGSSGSRWSVCAGRRSSRRAREAPVAGDAAADDALDARSRTRRCRSARARARPPASRADRPAGCRPPRTARSRWPASRISRSVASRRTSQCSVSWSRRTRHEEARDLLGDSVKIAPGHHRRAESQSPSVRRCGGRRSIAEGSRSLIGAAPQGYTTSAAFGSNDRVKRAGAHEHPALRARALTVAVCRRCGRRTPGARVRLRRHCLQLHRR